MKRPCEAVVIPGGEKVRLEKDEEISVFQSLGGSYTVLTNAGYFVRISEEDADALGKEPPHFPTAEEAAGRPVEELVLEQLKTCYDPEIPVDIVNLGLIYKNEITPLAEGGHKVLIEMTLTAPGCGMGGILAQDIERKLRRLPGVKDVKVELVFSPPWGFDKMSDAAKLKLGLM